MTLVDYLCFCTHAAWFAVEIRLKRLKLVIKIIVKISIKIRKGFSSVKCLV